MALSLKMKCTLHPRYDPSTQGEAAIRGACSTCYGLLEMWKAYLNIRQARFGKDDSEPHYNS